MILESISCAIVGILYTTFCVFKKEKRQELLEQISKEIKTEQTLLLLQQTKEEQSASTPLPDFSLKVKPKTLKTNVSSYGLGLEKYSRNEFNLESIYEYLKSNSGREIMYFRQKFKILYITKDRTIGLYEVNGIDSVSKHSSLMIKKSCESYKNPGYTYSLKLSGIFLHKESLMDNFKSHFVLVNQELFKVYENYKEYYSFILSVKRHYAENNITRRYHKISSAETFLQYCQIVGISYSHLNSTYLYDILRKLENGSITIDERERRF